MSALRKLTSRFGRRDTDLHSAAGRGDEEAVRSLLEPLTPDQRYEKLKVQGSRGHTALHYAAVRGRTDTARFLLSSLTPEDQLTLLKVQDSGGNTALHWAALIGQTDTARFLLSSLSPEDQLSLLDMQNKAGRTARDKAIEWDHPVTAACLQQIRDAAEEAISDSRNIQLQRVVTEEDLAGVLRAVDGLEAKVYQQSIQIDRQENTIRQRDAKVQQLEAAVDGLGAKVDQQDDKIRQRDAKVQQLEAAVDGLGAKVDQQNDKIRQRDAKVQQLEAALRDARRVTLSNSEEVGQLQNQQFQTVGLIDAVVERFASPVRAAEVVDSRAPLEEEGDMVGIQEIQQ